MIEFTLAPGTRIADRYRITGLIAHGGMGAVHEAVDERLGREVALKTLRSEHVADGTEVMRFEREAQMSARLSHPGIAQVLDFGRTPAGLLYLVMERIRGETLASLLTREKRVLPARAADIVEQALSALASAHAEGILHRDLKPGNVMVVPTGNAREVVKVLDFGIAHQMDGAAYTRLTRTGVILGTPAFMAPEQARGEPLDVRVDVYAMGVLLWCLLTGQKPFVGGSMADTIDALLNVVPQRADRVVQGIPHALASVAEVAMQKDPAQRFADANAMAHALALARMRSSFPPRNEVQAPSLFALSPPGKRISMPAILVTSTPPPRPSHAPPTQAPSAPPAPPHAVPQSSLGLASIGRTMTRPTVLAAGFLGCGSMTAAALLFGNVAFNMWTSRARTSRIAAASEPSQLPASQATPAQTPPPPEGAVTHVPLSGVRGGFPRAAVVIPECAQAFQCCEAWFAGGGGDATVCAPLIDGEGDTRESCTTRAAYYADMIHALRRSDIDCRSVPSLRALPNAN